ncbi:MAG: phenylalanine--tRNA ligase subunit beta [Schleiferiaceae bacterium]|nr:phenylalanine--tRNA ligase subunit beta [Schleiferiaceae bacterium]
MKISYNWLRQYYNCTLAPEKVAEVLTDTGLEVEGIETIESVPGGLKGVVVGHVLTCEQHPNADRLRVTTVDIGLEEPLHIVCGAPNVAAGQKVMVATVGTALTFANGESLKLKKGKIRGEVSEGMICAEDELGIGESHDGILVLPENTPTGTAAADYFNFEVDHVFEIGLTPNRTDAMSHFGVARDLHAALAFHHKDTTPLLLPDVSALQLPKSNEGIAVEVKDTAACPHYMGLTINNIKVAPSPEWLQTALRTIGLTPKNNVVDVTNYLLHELGHPLHAFDAGKIVGGKVVIQQLPADTPFTTLDEKERKLHADDLMICDTEKGLCMAGVFGGLGSGISESSTSVFLESAYFSPVSIRKTAKRHGLNTDASFRYERGIDPNLSEYALKRAAQLILELAGGEIAGAIQSVGQATFPPFEFVVSPNRIRRLIGTPISDSEMQEILTNLDITCAENGADTWTVRVPAYRVDVTREADIAEEVLRIYGLNKVPVPTKMNFSWIANQRHRPDKFRTMFTALLNGKGLTEVMNNSLSKASYYRDLPENEYGVNMLNPLSQELNRMRQNLTFGLLENVAYNQNRKRTDLRLFEWGKTYGKGASGFFENAVLAVALTGKSDAENWEHPQRESSFFSLKAHVLELCNAIGASPVKEALVVEHPLYSDAIELFHKKQSLGIVGRVKDEWLKYFDIQQDVFTAELHSEALFERSKNRKVIYQSLPKFPAVRRDLALLVPKEVTYAALANVVQQSGTALLQSVALFDVYAGKNLPEGKKSYAISLIFQSPDKTLQDKQIEGVVARILKQLEQQLQVVIR